jgi:hypothetical protein
MTAVGIQVDRGSATIAQTSSMTAIGTQIDKTTATIAQTSSMTGAGRYTISANATGAETSSMTALGRQIDRGKVTGGIPGQELSGFSASGGLKWTVIQNPTTTWTQLTKEQAA